ncbi:MAG: diadenylate cyclase, partial [Opitutales bacterium]|nr:diadenylate cyclase [Opitutales bacterium]
LTHSGSEFAAEIKRVFAFKGSRKVERLVELIEAGMGEKKGTMLVISKKAKEEAKRLAAQSTPIAPIVLTRQLLGSLTSIDGAILLDPSGVCHCIGAILDGMATANGDSTRGARYNSAVKYIDSRKALGESCMAVVISEDGNIDILS